MILPIINYVGVGVISQVKDSYKVLLVLKIVGICFVVTVGVLLDLLCCLCLRISCFTQVAQNKC